MIIKAKTFKNWMLANFSKQELNDLANHGANAGWHGLTYYSDTVKLFEKFKDEIFESLVQDTEDFGYSNIYELLATFNKNYMPYDYAQFANQLTWYMAEKIARDQTND